MNSMNNASTALLYSAQEPTAAQRKRFADFLARTYPGQALTLEWKEDASLAGGFRLEVGPDIYDWSLQGRMQQLRQRIEALDNSDNVLPLMRQTIEDWAPSTKPEEMGTVLTVGDEIATIAGLEDGRLRRSAGLFQRHQGHGPGAAPRPAVLRFVRRQQRHRGRRPGPPHRQGGRRAGGRGLPRPRGGCLGSPIDGAGPIQADAYYPVERPAPGIIDRQPVNQPMETGLLAIDALFPIGRGQRELIIGDRQTGKTAVALDTILNQKGKNVVCIYVAIGQKASSVALLAENLRRRGAMDYCIIVNASASDSASLQYIAPYAGTSIGEYFMHQGRDVLIVYDDLSKHAIAYRALSLLLERSPGREAYPGDVFYLHSRLLERSAHLSDEKGGGSMTALPIIETQAGDVSAYIPTNVISITDGQLFLESSLFFSGQRPAVNVGLSVSRVGGDAQTKAMKKAAGAMRLDLAQYREMEVFTQFSSDLDDATKRQLTYGQGLMRLLRQKQYSPLSQHEQVITLVAALNHVLQDIPVEQISGAQRQMLDWFAGQDAALCQRIDSTGLLTEDDRQQILSLARTFVAQYQKKGQ